MRDVSRLGCWDSDFRTNRRRVTLANWDCMLAPTWEEVFFAAKYVPQSLFYLLMAFAKSTSLTKPSVPDLCMQELGLYYGQRRTSLATKKCQYTPCKFTHLTHFPECANLTARRSHQIYTSNTRRPTYDSPFQRHSYVRSGAD